MLDVEMFGTKLSAVAANAAEASRTVVLDVRHCSAVCLGYSLTRVAATAMSATLYKSTDGGTTYFRVPSVAVAAGSGTEADYTISKSVSGSDSLAIDVDVESCTHLKAIFAATGGGATDYITVIASGAVWS